MADLNAALRASLTDVLIDTLPDGAVRVDARFRKPHTIVIPQGVWFWPTGEQARSET